MATSVGSHSGIELNEVCRGHELMADVPTLFLATQDDVEQTGFLISADDTLIKPVPPSVLRARAASRLERFRHTLKSNQIDRLTGCLGRAALLRAADREVGLARRSGNPLSVVLIDIDGMHAVNEKHGLVGGDRVLKALAEVLSFNLRETDLVGRAGGDAFGALLPKCGVLDARKRIENVRRKYQAWFTQQGMDPVEFSAGIADTGDGFRDVLARADRALIEARHAGGSRSSLGR
jgi:diguanylate cyclase (GGDEF)-like protein